MARDGDNTVIENVQHAGRVEARVFDPKTATLEDCAIAFGVLSDLEYPQRKIRYSIPDMKQYGLVLMPVSGGNHQNLRTYADRLAGIVEGQLPQDQTMDSPARLAEAIVKAVQVRYGGAQTLEKINEALNGRIVD